MRCSTVRIKRVDGTAVPCRNEAVGRSDLCERCLVRWEKVQRRQLPVWAVSR